MIRFIFNGKPGIIEKFDTTIFVYWEGMGAHLSDIDPASPLGTFLQNIIPVPG